MTGLVIESAPFIAVQPEVVRAIGSMEAAAILAVVQYRQPARHVPVAISVRDFTEATGLSESTVKRQTRALVDSGMMTRVQEPGHVAEYTVRWGQGDLGGGVKLTSPHCLTREVTNNPPTGGVKVTSPGVVVDLFGNVEEEVPEWPSEATPNGCRQAFLAAWSESHGHIDPSIRRRACGVITNLCKQRETLDDWRALWTACRDAGKAGRWDVAALLAPQPQSRFVNRDPFIDRAQAAAASGVLDSMLGALEDPQRVGGLRPRAIGS